MKKILLIYFANLLLFSSVFTALFHSSLFNFQKVFFYRGFFLLLITVVIMIFFEIFFLRKHFLLNLESAFASIMVAASINLAIFVVFPVTFERSVTMFLLNSLSAKTSDKLCSGLTTSQLQNNLINGYIIKGKAVDKRINEQEIINMMQRNKQCVTLTSRGKKFLDFSIIIKRIYNIK